MTSTWKMSRTALIVVVASGSVFAGGVGMTAPGRPRLPARYDIAITFGKIAGGFGGPESCPKAVRNGSDVLTGTVEGTEQFVGDAMEYTGTLSRVTDITHCEMWRPKGEDVFCTPRLKGKQARVKTTITIWHAKSNQDTEVEFEPLVSSTDTVAVTGACTGDMELDITALYLKSDAFQIVTRNQDILAKLVAGLSWQDVKPRPANQPDGWTLAVVKKLQ